MKVLTVVKTPQYWAFPKDIARITGYKSPTKLLKSFRDFCEARPNYFKPCKPILVDGETQYNIACFLHYYENRTLLDSGTRSLNFKDDLPRLMEAYSFHLLPEEVI